MKRKNWRSFPESRKFVQLLKLKNTTEWKEFTKSPKFPKDLPRYPPATYVKEWKNWADFLGTQNKKGGWWSFTKAKAWATKSDIKSSSQWRITYKNNKIPKDIPIVPSDRYKKEWKGWADFLGVRSMRNWMSFTSARTHIRKLKFQKQSDYHKYIKSKNAPETLPIYPDSAYKNKGWKGWPDFLGTDYIPPQLREYKSFEEARDYARSLNLDKFDAWRNHVKAKLLPKDIPSVPHKIYKDKGWKSYPDWLGTDTISPKEKHAALPPFRIACVWAKSTGIERFDEWKEITKLDWMPFEIPVNPSDAYKKEWKNWSHFLGTGKHISGDAYAKLDESRKFAQKLNLNSNSAWHTHWKTHKIPHNIPLNPDQAYKKQGWVNWSDFLGSRPTSDFWSYKKSSTYLKKYNFKSRAGFNKLRKSGKLNNKIPLDPQAYYKDKGWKGWGDYLGTGNKSFSQISENYRPWKEAKPIYRRLAKEYGLKNREDWRKFVKSHKKLLEKLRIPANPQNVYTKERELKRMMKDG